MDPLIILQQIHSLVRWLVVLVALAALIWGVMGLLNRANAKTERIVMSAFAGFIDLQVLVGLILLIWSGLATPIGFPRYRMEHTVIMLVAAAVAHLPMRWRKADLPQATRSRNNLIVVAVVLVLVYAGVALLPQGWYLG
jgi:hypothetical protein